MQQMNSNKVLKFLAALSLAVAVPAIAYAVCGVYYDHSYVYPGYDATWTKSASDAYSASGIGHCYGFGGDAGWGGPEEGVDCSAYLPRCWAIPGYVAQSTLAPHPYTTRSFYPDNGGASTVPHCTRVTVNSINDIQPWDCFVVNEHFGTLGIDHMGLIVRVDSATGTIYTREAYNTATGIIANSWSYNTLVVNGQARIFRRAAWGTSDTHINPCTANTSDGRIELFAIGNSGSLYHSYQTNANGSWKTWTTLGTLKWSVSALPAVGVNKDGRLEVFVVGTNSSIYHAYQKAPGSSAATNWSGFSIVSSSRVCQTAKLAVGKWSNGALDLFVIGTDCVLYHNYQTTAGNSTSWSGFNSLGGSWDQNADISVASENDGRLDVFVIDGLGNLFNNFQTAINSTTWNGFHSLSSVVPILARTAVGRDNNGRLNAFVIGTDGVCYYRTETAANSPTSWTSWASLAGNTFATDAKPVITHDQNGALELFIVGSNQNLYHNYQTGASWSGWISLGGTFAQNIRPCIGPNADGRLQIFLNQVNGVMDTSWETSVNGTAWFSWFSLGGTWK
jgi:hypothetical protein